MKQNVLQERLNRIKQSAALARFFAWMLMGSLFP